MIIRDSGLKSLVECTHPDQAPSDDSIPHLRKLYPAYVSLYKSVKAVAKRKAKK